jgi:hypothetical protein
MDLRAYYQKIREWEAKIVHDFAVVNSRETTDGGRSGTLTEVSKRTAAKLIVDGVAELANAEEVAKFRAAIDEAKRAAEAAAAKAAGMQLALIPKMELDSLRANQRDSKE